MKTRLQYYVSEELSQEYENLDQANRDINELRAYRVDTSGIDRAKFTRKITILARSIVEIQIKIDNLIHDGHSEISEYYLVRYIQYTLDRYIKVHEKNVELFYDGLLENCEDTLAGLSDPLIESDVYSNTAERIHSIAQTSFRGKCRKEEDNSDNMLRAYWVAWNAIKKELAYYVGEGLHSNSTNEYRDLVQKTKGRIAFEMTKEDTLNSFACNLDGAILLSHPGKIRYDFENTARDIALHCGDAFRF